MSAMTNSRELFLAELADVYYAEKTLEKALPQLAAEASDAELARGFEQHHRQTQRHVKTVERVFKSLGEPAKAEQCPGIDGIKEEHDTFMSEHDPSPHVRDLFLTGAAARAEHYEIAAYTSLAAMATGLRETEASKLLRGTLREEKETLRKVETISRRLAKHRRAPSRASSKK